jgi:hypothetical protein
MRSDHFATYSWGRSLRSLLHRLPWRWNMEDEVV